MGNQRKFTAKIMINIKPNQKIGTEYRINIMLDTNVSILEGYVLAAKTPSSIPIKIPSI
jgi:hypothetical protein